MLVAVLDSSVLFPNTLRDVLLTIAEHELFRPHWSAAILDEVRRNVIAKRHVDPIALDRTLRLMTAAFDGAEVAGWEDHVDRLQLPDPEDRHVLAAAIIARADVIVTANLTDFPSKSLRAHRVDAMHPDDFLLDRLDEAPGLVIRILCERIAELRRPPMDLNGLLDRLARCGVGGFVEEVRRLSSWRHSQR